MSVTFLRKLQYPVNTTYNISETAGTLRPNKGTRIFTPNTFAVNVYECYCQDLLFTFLDLDRITVSFDKLYKNIASKLLGLLKEVRKSCRAKRYVGVCMKG